MYWDHMNGWGWTMMVIWSLVRVGFVGVIAWFAVQWTRNSSHSSPPSQSSRKTVRALLDERLAHGEIDMGEYERCREALDRHSHVSV